MGGGGYTDREEGPMYGVFIEVDASESQIPEAREELRQNIAPAARAAGARAGYWLAPHGHHGVAVVVFDSEEEARKMATQLTPGENAGVPGVTFRTVEVSEVLAAL